LDLQQRAAKPMMQRGAGVPGGAGMWKKAISALGLYRESAVNRSGQARQRSNAWMCCAAYPKSQAYLEWLVQRMGNATAMPHLKKINIEGSQGRTFAKPTRIQYRGSGH